MMRALIPTLLISCLGPVAIEPEPPATMIFDVRHIPTIHEMIVRESIEQGVPSHLAVMIAYRESRFDPNAINQGSRCKGLYQLAPHTIRVLHVADPFDAQQSAIAGIGIFGNYLRFGGERYALCAFARGPGHCKFQTGARK